MRFGPDTETHIVLTGRWIEPDFGKGVFIAVFPVILTDEILLETVASVPMENLVPVAVADSLSDDDEGWGC